MEKKFINRAISLLFTISELTKFWCTKSSNVHDAGIFLIIVTAIEIAIYCCLIAISYKSGYKKLVQEGFLLAAGGIMLSILHYYKYYN